MPKVAIHGAGGRMGKRLVALGIDDPSIELVAAVETENHPFLGTDAGVHAGTAAINIPLSSEFPKQADVVIDFSLPTAVDSILEKCVAAQTPIVIATTGFGDSTTENIQKASQTVPVVWAPNMSLAVNLSMKLAEIAAAALKNSDADVEILERHHRFKADAPSGTALKFGQLIADQMGIDNHQHGRVGETGQRSHNEIGYHAIRTGDDAGQHTILFGMMGEKIEINVSASNRDCYATGALTAAKFLHNKSPGLYDMYDVLGLN